jgi:hypothetical protein
MTTERERPDFQSGDGMDITRKIVSVIGFRLGESIPTGAFS